MFMVEEILISDDVLSAPFLCNLGACKGGCCVQGESGAPLEEDELPIIEEVYPIVKKYLRPEALETIEKKGLWEKEGRNSYGTTCVDDAECVFVTYEGEIAKCAIHIAYQKGEVTFPKPISCHLFPVRVSETGTHEVLNYEQVDLCSPAVKRGRKKNMMLPNFLEEPLVRKYGKTWYRKFLEACKEQVENKKP